MNAFRCDKCGRFFEVPPVHARTLTTVAEGWANPHYHTVRLTVETAGFDRAGLHDKPQLCAACLQTLVELLAVPVPIP